MHLIDLAAAKHACCRGSASALCSGFAQANVTSFTSVEPAANVTTCYAFVSYQRRIDDTAQSTALVNSAPKNLLRRRRADVLQTFDAACNGKPQSLKRSRRRLFAEPQMHLFARPALSCPIILTYFTLVSTIHQEIPACFALQSFRATSRKQLHRLFYNESRFFSVEGQAHAKRLPYPHVITKRPLSTHPTPQILSFLDGFTCSTVTSAHDKAPFRNDPAVRSKTRTLAAQPRFQTIRHESVFSI